MILVPLTLFRSLPSRWPSYLILSPPLNHCKPPLRYRTKGARWPTDRRASLKYILNAFVGQTSLPFARIYSRKFGNCKQRMSPGYRSVFSRFEGKQDVLYIYIYTVFNYTSGREKYLYVDLSLPPSSSSFFPRGFHVSRINETKINIAYMYMHRARTKLIIT